MDPPLSGCDLWDTTSTPSSLELWETSCWGFASNQSTAASIPWCPVASKAFLESSMAKPISFKIEQSKKKQEIYLDQQYFLVNILADLSELKQGIEGKI